MYNQKKKKNRLLLFVYCFEQMFSVLRNGFANWLPRSTLFIFKIVYCFPNCSVSVVRGLVFLVVSVPVYSSIDYNLSYPILLTYRLLWRDCHLRKKSDRQFEHGTRYEFGEYVQIFIFSYYRRDIKPYVFRRYKRYHFIFRRKQTDVLSLHARYPLHHHHHHHPQFNRRL